MAGPIHGLFVISTPAVLVAVNVAESNVVGAADVQVLGVQVPLAVKVPAQPVEVVTEQAPLTQHDPVDAVVGQLDAAMIGTKATTTASRTSHLNLFLEASDMNDHSLIL